MQKASLSDYLPGLRMVPLSDHLSFSVRNTKGGLGSPSEGVY